MPFARSLFRILSIVSTVGRAAAGGASVAAMKAIWCWRLGDVGHGARHDLHFYYTNSKLFVVSALAAATAPPSAGILLHNSSLGIRYFNCMCVGVRVVRHLPREFTDAMQCAAACVYECCVRVVACHLLDEVKNTNSGTPTNRPTEPASKPENCSS